jgi:transcriptional regulator with XRE-family HTH domain
MDAQRKTTPRLGVEQLSLLPARLPSPPPDLSYLRALPNLRRAIRYAMSLADLEPKQVYMPLGKDKATWSRIENGDMSFPADDLVKLCHVIGNDAPLLYLNHAAGYDIEHMVRIKSSLEKENEELKARVAELEKEREIEQRAYRALLAGK